MREIFTGLLKFLSKVPATVLLLTASCASWLILLAPITALEFLGVLNFRNNYRSVIGLILLVSTIILSIQFVLWLLGWVRGWFAYSGRDARRRIKAVGEWNQALIKQLYERPSHAQKLPLQSANVQALLSENLLARAYMGDAVGFDCVLQPWVVQYLDSHPDFVAHMKSFSKPFTVELPFL